MSRAASAVVLGGAWAAWALDFAGWVLMLSGASAMQADCGSSDATFLLSGGAAGYNAPVSCNRFFSYLWWHTFYNFTVWIITAATLVGFLSRFRPGLVVLLAIALMQALESSNNWLYFDTLPTSSSAFTARAKVAASGAIIKAIALFFLIGFVGYRNEETTIFEKPAKRKGKGAGAPGGPPPGGARGASTNVLEPESTTVAVRPGRIGESTPAAGASPV